MRLPDPDGRAWLDGREDRVPRLAVPVTDPALHAGLAVFETLCLRAGRPLDLARHLERLRHAATQLGIPLPDTAALEAAIDAACRERSSPRAWLKLLATRGGRWIVFTGALDAEQQHRPLSAIVLPWRRDARDPLLALKTTCRGGQTLGLEMAHARGAQEGLWLNAHGRLSEGCASNLFVVRRGAVHTPALGEGMLPGIVRACAIAAGRALGIPTHEGRVRLERLRRAHEAFMTNSLSGVRPLVRVEGRPVGRGEAGPITERIAREVERMRQSGW